MCFLLFDCRRLPDNEIVYITVICKKINNGILKSFYTDT